MDKLVDLLTTLADWERENGTLAAIMPHEYADLCERLKRAAAVQGARAALAAPRATDAAGLVERLRKELAHHIAYSDTAEGELAAEAADRIEADAATIAAQAAEIERLRGDVERKDAALKKAADTFQHYGELHAAKPDAEKAARNYNLEREMRAAMEPRK